MGDHSIRDAVNAVTGAGRRDWHVAGFVQRRDAKVEGWGSFAQARAGDPCPRCGKPLDIARGIEVGHIFKLGTKYSTALGCTFTDEKGETHPAVMGTYGIGVGRTMAAAIEQHHDADGIVWPLAHRALRDRARVAQPVGRDDPARGRRPLRSHCSGPASTSSTTIATSGRASSSRTRTSSASRSA